MRFYLRQLSPEEFANTLTHGFGLALSVVGFIFLFCLALLAGNPWHIASTAVYGISLVVLYTASTLYHGATTPRRKEILRIADHCGIYLLIAGSYTPFGLLIANGLLGKGLLILIWFFALSGVLLKILFRHRFPVVSVASYVVMGWLGIFALQPLMEVLGIMPVAMALAGGLAYTIGVVFFAWDRLPHNHAIFHVFVLAGSIVHYLAIAIYVVPYAINL